MPENQSFGTSSSIQDYRKSVNSRLTPSTIESKDPFVMEKPSQAELKQGPKIVGVADDRTAPQKLLRGLTVLWRKFTSNSIGPSSNFEGSAVEYTSDGSAPGHWYISAENQHDSLDIVVEDNKFAMDDTVDPSETSHHSTGGRNQYTHSQGHASAHASDLGPLSSVPSYLSYLSRIKWCLQHFFLPRFEDAHQERIFQQEWWAQRKRLAIAFSLYLMINYILYLVLNKDLASLYSRITFFGVSTALTVPLPFLLAFDGPVKQPLFFQLYFTCAVWVWGYSEIIQSRVCGYWPDSQPCNGKDFLLLVFYCTGYPTLAVFVVQNRLFATIGATIGIVLLGIFIMPTSGSFSRVLVAYVLYHGFIIATHWVHEGTERRMFRLNIQLKTAYRAQQRAQVKESEAASSKRRFVSYIFHEVRVPLNTALLSFQNLQNNSAFQVNEDNELELHALEGSLSMMGKVLNDVLDLNRMNAGKFESCDKPFPLHRAMQTTLGGLGIATAAKHIKLNVQLDPAIDALAQPSVNANQAPGVWLKGDDMRLIQVLTNLASNACKFTPPGGSITLSTRLLKVQHPANVLRHANPIHLEKGYGQPREFHEGRKRLIVRFEVQDTGPGISLSDIQAQTLFTPFVQTAAGRASGKGSGLGLSIVRQIVKLSGGRVGVKSRPGEGSTFWFELAFWTATLPEINSSVEWKNAGMDRVSTNSRMDSSEGDSSESPNGGIPSPVEKAMRPVLDRLMSFDTSLKASMPRLMPASNESSRPIDGQGLRVPVEGMIVGPMDKPVSPEETSALESQPSTRLSDVSSSRPLLPNESTSSLSVPRSTSARTRDDSLSQRMSTIQSDVGERLSPTVTASPQHDLESTSSSSTPKPPNTTASETLKPPAAPGQSNSCPALPVSSMATEDSKDTSKPAAEEVAKRPLNVLVVDDDGLTRKLMSRMLQRQGCNISTAEDGQHALDLLLDPEPHYFDCVFLDNQMPRKTGLDVVRELRAAGRTEQVVGVTGNALREDQEGYLKAGADHVLIKPVLAGDLTRMLDMARQRMSP